MPPQNAEQYAIRQSIDIFIIVTSNILNLAFYCKYLIKKELHFKFKLIVDFLLLTMILRLCTQSFNFIALELDYKH